MSESEFLPGGSAANNRILIVGGGISGCVRQVARKRDFEFERALTNGARRLTLAILLEQLRFDVVVVDKVQELHAAGSGSCAAAASPRLARTAHSRARRRSEPHWPLARHFGRARH